MERWGFDNQRDYITLTVDRVRSIGKRFIRSAKVNRTERLMKRRIFLGLRVKS